MSQETFYFYDLETTGFGPREARIMQFAGQRTDRHMNPLGEPHNFLIRLSEEILPDPDAILVTGITPQQTRIDGITEAEFLRIFESEISTPGTIFVGFNSIRFDDEFMRFLQYRNFYDAYEWQWRDGRSRWDLLDLVRMTRALRPDGIKWPVDSTGKAANRLELLTSINGLDHLSAHDALSDVLASIALAKLIHTKQPKLFSYLLGMRKKEAVSALALQDNPFVYTSGKYPSEFEKTTVAVTIIKHPTEQAAVVFDLRHDPTPFGKMTAEELVEAWKWREPGDDHIRLPAKTMRFNRCPAIAPMSVLDKNTAQRLSLDLELIQENLKLLRSLDVFGDRLARALEIMNKQRQEYMFQDQSSVDGALYDGFVGDQDKRLSVDIRSAKPDDLESFTTKLHDKRLQHLLPLYKARNFHGQLSSAERKTWDDFCHKRLFDGGETSRLAKYFLRIEELRARPGITKKQLSILTDLELYGQSLLPSF